MLKLYSIFLRGTLSCVALMFGTVIDAQAGYLYVLNDNSAGSNIYGYSVNEATGALTALAGFPVATGGTDNSGNNELLTIDRANNRLYIVNDPSNTVSAYSIDPTTGALTALPFSPIALPTGNYLTIAVHPSGSPLVISNTGSLASYVITATTATAAAGSPFLPVGASPLSSVFSRDGNYFYTGGTSGNNFAGFSVNAATGVLTALAGSPFNSGDFNPSGYATDSQGRIFLTNVFANRLRVFTTASGIPSAVTGNPFTSGLTAAFDAVLSPNENFYLVADRTGNRVGSYQITGTGAATTLTATAGSPVGSGGSRTNTLVFNSAGTFVFAANSISLNITTYGFDSTTGALAFNNVQAANTLGAAGLLTGIDYLPTGTTAAGVAVSGRVTAGKRGVARAAVLLTDTDGITRRATTDWFGYYRFEAVPVGETYIIEVRSKKLTFAPQVLTITEEQNNLNFHGN